MQRAETQSTINQGRSRFADEPASPLPGSFRSRAEEEILETLRGGAVPLDQFEGKLDEVRSLISRGLARMVVSEYAWGIEFGVELIQVVEK